MKDWTSYQKRTLDNDVSNLLKYFLDNYQVKDAIDLGCGSGNETVYMVKHGVKVTAVDRQLNEDFILNRLDEEEKANVSFIESDFESVNLPKTDMIGAFFSIPFCNPKHFNELWDKIYSSLNENGYFVGQLFGDRDSWSENPNINTFTLMEVKDYLKNYEVLKLEEVEYVRKEDNKKWHFFDIIARRTK